MLSAFASPKFLTHADFLLKCLDLFCSPVCSTHNVLPEALSSWAMNLQTFLNPIAFRMKNGSSILLRASTEDATSASVPDKVNLCVLDTHSTAAVYSTTGRVCRNSLTDLEAVVCGDSIMGSVSAKVD